MLEKVRLVAAFVLALPLLLFGADYFLGFMDMEMEGAQAGLDLLQAMRDGGLMAWIAASHLIIGAMLVVPRFRFVAGLLQLPMTIGMVAFHVTMLPEGNVGAFVMLALNLLVIADDRHIRALVAPDRETE